MNVIGASSPGTARLQLLARTDDLDEFRSLTEGPCGAERTRSDGHGRLRARLHGLQFGALRLARVSFALPLCTDVVGTRDAWTLTRVIEGSVEMRSGAQSRRVDAGSVALFAPDWRGRSHAAAGTKYEALRVDARSLQEVASELLGFSEDESLRLSNIEGRADSSHRLGQMFDALVATPSYSGRIGAQYERMAEHAFLLELLALWPHADASRLPKRPAAPRAVARACEYVDAHLAEPLTVSDIAGAANVGPRALTLAFAKHLGTSPARYLRERRLAAARQALLEPESSASVTDVALQWQFGHPGLFARYYRARFGEFPHQTRQRR